ncbi:NUDIX hydrolase [Chryseolinea sp. T2]|uniref:NUDIX hydrolase n=1 Tax=Chryseolinea sp. T2 TaxID=3129255 RepID=UPI0030784D1B
MSDEITETYGKRVRVRACGLLYENDNLLLVNHTLPGRPEWWAPPGGGVEFGETLEDALKREFEEETGLKITVGQFAFGCEFIGGSLHAIELFFHVTRLSGTPTIGNDPELAIITDVQFMAPQQINSLSRDAIHGIFKLVSVPNDLLQMKGFFRI